MSNYCNHRCPWCTAYEYQKDKALGVDRSDLLLFSKKASNKGLKSVGYVGNGEPTAYPKFNELTDSVGNLGIEQGVFTNGYLINRSIDYLLNNFTYIRISLDAGSEKVHSSWRARGRIRAAAIPCRVTSSCVPPMPPEVRMGRWSCSFRRLIDVLIEDSSSGSITAVVAGHLRFQRVESSHS